MNIEPQLAFKNIEPSDVVRAIVDNNIRKLQKHHRALSSCRVVFERPQHRHKTGDHYRVSVDLKMTGGIEVAVTRNPPLDKDRDSAFVALREAFDIADRQLTEVNRRQQNHGHERKGLTHEAELAARSRMTPEDLNEETI